MKSLRFRQLVRCTTQPGTGPSAKKMDQGWFRCYFFGRSRTGQITRALMTGNGDPANRFTVQFACESALAIACGDPSLPERYGVLTPATGIGDALWNRMKNSGIQMDEIVEH